MSLNLICRRCGEPGFETVIAVDGAEMARGILCDPCMTTMIAAAEENRGIFQELLASGVSRERANELMIARLDGQGAES